MKQRAKHFGFVISTAALFFILVSGFITSKNTAARNSRTSVPAGGVILGIVIPFSIKTTILAVSVSDTVAFTFSDTTNGAYILKDIPSGNYALIFVPSDNKYRKNSSRAAVSEGQITIADTVWLLK